jgi:hypothetical protein
MKRLIIGATLLGILAGPVYAQQKQEDSLMVLEEKQRKSDAAAVDRQYRSVLEKTRKDAAENRTDPWANMRGPDDSKTKR